MCFATRPEPKPPARPIATHIDADMIRDETRAALGSGSGLVAKRSYVDVFCDDLGMTKAKHSPCRSRIFGSDRFRMKSPLCKCRFAAISASSPGGPLQKLVFNMCGSELFLLNLLHENADVGTGPRGRGGGLFSTFVAPMGSGVVAERILCFAPTRHRFSRTTHLHSCILRLSMGRLWGVEA